MQKNFCYHCLKVRIMYKDRYNDSLVRFFSVYYEKISENEVKSIINYTLGLKNDRFSRFIENGKRVDNILDLAKIESGYLCLHTSSFSLSELVREIAMKCESRVSDEVKIIVKKPENDYWAELDKKRITQVLEHFVMNALKYTSQGYIEITYEVKEAAVILSVTDTGCGIPSDKLNKVFDRFEKADSFVQGIGIGLSICKSIVEQMGGCIGVESELNAGSKFWIEVPCHPICCSEEKNSVYLMS